MKALFLVFIAALIPATDPAKISRINEIKKEAHEAYSSGDYKQAAQKYRYLIDSMGVSEDEVTLNLANALYLAADTLASTYYTSLTQTASEPIQSKAHQQLGVIANKKGNAEEALSHFKEAIKSDPANDEARYNYEMLKKKLEEQKKNQNKQNQNQQNQKNQQKDQQKDQQQDQQKKDQQQQDQQQKDQQQKDQQQQQDQQQKDQQQNEQQNQQDQQQKDQQQQQQNLANKLKEMNISEEKAKMILEAMKNQEIQYYQEMKRKPTQPPDNSKPDW